MPLNPFAFGQARTMLQEESDGEAWVRTYMTMAEAWIEMVPDVVRSASVLVVAEQTNLLFRRVDWSRGGSDRRPLDFGANKRTDGPFTQIRGHR